MKTSRIIVVDDPGTHSDQATARQFWADVHRQHKAILAPPATVVAKAPPIAAPFPPDSTADGRP